MSKIKLEIFKNSAETVSFIPERSKYLGVEFTEAVDGYVIIGSQSVRIQGNSCELDVRALPDGEYIPRLILENQTIDLPPLIKECGLIIEKARSLGEIGELSLRERRLNRRVERLEEKLKEISDKIYGTTIF